MNKIYYEIRILASNYLDSFENYLFDYGVMAVEEENDELIVRIEEDPQELIDALKSYANELSEIFQEEVEIKITSDKKDNKDWIEIFKQSIDPVEVGSFWIRPSWHEPKKDRIDLIIDPALAFGTGHHASTRGVLTLIEKYAKSGQSLLDIGTGSGILAIAAAKLGLFCDVCDTDEIAIKSAKENAMANDIIFDKTWVGSATQAKKEYDCVLANIVADVILLIAKDILRSCKQGGTFILSGIVENRLDDILAKFAVCELLEIINEEGWASVAYRKK